MQFLSSAESITMGIVSAVERGNILILIVKEETAIIVKNVGE